MEPMNTIEDCDKRIAEIDEDIAKSTSEIDRLTIEVKKLKIARHYTVQLRQLFAGNNTPEPSEWIGSDVHMMLVDIIQNNPGITHERIMQEITKPLTARQVTYQLAYISRHSGKIENRGGHGRAARWYVTGS